MLLVVFATGISIMSHHLKAQASSIVPVGSGSYTTAQLPNTQVPPNKIYRTSRLTGPMPTNDWWTSVAWTQSAFPIYPLPLALQTTTTGIGVSYPDLETENVAVHAGYKADFMLGAATNTFPSPNPLVDGYSDWSVSLLWDNGSGGTMRVTAGQGLPYLYTTYHKAKPQLTFSAPPTIWFGNISPVAAATDSRPSSDFARASLGNTANSLSIAPSGTGSSVLGITSNGHNYALFGPTGSIWSGLGTTILTNDLQGQDYLSLAVLPDKKVSTLQHFLRYAYSFVTNTQVSWSYDQLTSQVNTRYRVTTQAQQGRQTGTILTLFPNQWKVTNRFEPLPHTYHSIRGTMKTLAGSSFATTLTYHGILPIFPDIGQYDQRTLIDDIEMVHSEKRDPTVGDTYWGGKALLRIAALLPLAHETGITPVYKDLLAWLENAMADHFTATDPAGNPKITDLFYYDPTWGTLIGYPASYGSDTDLNDHHFHYGYWINAAAEIAREDPTWVSKYGGMVNMLIDDIADPNRTDSRFPFLRNFSPYEGHSWASGSELAAWGNNQESSSEAVNAWAGLIEWGAATGNTQLRDLGIYLYTTETQAIEQYWFNVDHDNFPAGYGFDYTAQVWSGQIWNGTYFSADPQDIRGINLLPITPGSLYLADNTSYEQEFLQNMQKEHGSNTWSSWQDTLWEYQSLIDAPGAIKLFNAQPSYTPGGSETKAFTYSMLYDLQTLGKVNAAITANTPLYAVFSNGNTVSHVVYNAGNTPTTVTFSDKTSFSVPPRQISVNGKTISGHTLPKVNGLQISAAGGENYPFVADQDYSGGMTTLPTNVAINTSGVSNPAPQGIYQKNRYGDFTYSVPGLKAGASYTVRLHFAETYWTQPGQRTFNVSLNGEQVLSNFDILAAAGGANKAVVKQFTVTADANGKIMIQFTSVKDNAQVSGIEVLA